MSRAAVLALSLVPALLTGSAIAAPMKNATLPPPPSIELAAPDASALHVAVEGLTALQHGAATGEWTAFEAMLSDDVSFYAPVAGFDGLLRGKAEAHRLFLHHAANTRTTWTLMRTVANGAEIGFEVRAEGAIRDQGDGYSNNLFMLLRIADGRIVQFREYASTPGYKGHEVGRGAFEQITSEPRR